MHENSPDSSVPAWRVCKTRPMPIYPLWVALISPTTRRTRCALQPCVGMATDRSTATLFFRCCRITLKLGPEVWRVLAKCHDVRNRAEYEGDLDVDERLVADLMASCQAVASALDGLPPSIGAE